VRDGVHGEGHDIETVGDVGLPADADAAAGGTVGTCRCPPPLPPPRLEDAFGSGDSVDVFDGEMAAAAAAACDSLLPPRLLHTAGAAGAGAGAVLGHPVGGLRVSDGNEMLRAALPLHRIDQRLVHVRRRSYSVLYLLLDLVDDYSFHWND
jgi:hypothetical protein